MMLALVILSLLAISNVSASEITDGTSDLLSSNNDEAIIDLNEDKGLFESNSDGTFTDLANEIVNATGELNLTRNYVYRDDDSDYKEGIVIDKKITINGNGFTINGNNQTRIFNVTSSNVIFNNICFMNSYSSGSGGAIYGKGSSAVNCTFIGNSAASGGAIYGRGSSALNCTFIGNSALNQGGGAMSSGSAVNCTFIGNSALNQGGGAMSSGSAVNCTFIGNSARYGGAMAGYSAINSTFINNSAWDYGGAFSGKGSSAVNCTFIGNSAGDYGGAMAYVSSADGCTFINNSAVRYGGAMYDGSAVNSIFINNSAGDYGGGAIFSGSAVRCTFVNNDVSGVDCVNCTFIPVATVINAPDLTTVYGACEKLVITLTDIEGNVLSGAQITVLLNNKSYEECTDSKGEVSIAIPNNLNPSNYAATISYAGDDIYLPSNSTAYVIVNKAKTNLSIAYNAGELVATLINNVTGQYIKGANVIFTVNGEKYTAKTDLNGKAKVSISGLAPGTYEAAVSYNGNSKYCASSGTFNVVVNKISTSISLYYDSETRELVATLINAETGIGITGANVVFNINGVKTVLKTKNGKARFSIGDVNPNTFNGGVSYGGNSKYFKSTASIKIVEGKMPTVISNVYDKYAGEVVATLINFENGNAIKGANVVFNVNGVKTVLKTDKLGQVKISVVDFDSGVLSVGSSYGGNSKYGGSTAGINIVKS